MWARYDVATRRLKHWSIVPFTVLTDSSEADREFPDGTTLPESVAVLRLTADLTGLEVDPDLQAARQTHMLQNQLAATDGRMARVAEDVIDALIAKGALQLADLPAASQANLTQRKQLRKQLSG